MRRKLNQCEENKALTFDGVLVKEEWSDYSITEDTDFTPQKLFHDAH